MLQSVVPRSLTGLAAEQQQISGSLVLFHWSTCLTSHIVSVTIAIRSIEIRIFQLFFNIVLAVLVLLPLYIDFRIIYTRNNFDWSFFLFFKAFQFVLGYSQLTML